MAVVWVADLVAELAVVSAAELVVVSAVELVVE